MKDWRLIYIIFAKSEDKLYISNKNRQAYFVLLSVCIIFVRINLKNCNVMFDKETYVQRRALLKKNIGSGVLLFLGNDEQGLNYEDNAFRYRQDSTFLYYFGLSFAGLSAIIDIDEDKEIIFGDELTIDHIYDGPHSAFENDFFVLIDVNDSGKSGKRQAEIVEESRILTITESIIFIIQSLFVISQE